MKDEALKLVLEALEAATRYGAGGFEDAKDALREAQAAQEPVAWLEHLKRLASICPELNMVNYSDGDADDLNCWAIEVATYIDGIATPPAAQRQWVKLTDEEIKEVNAKVSQIPPIDYTTTTYARAIEAKLKEKNT
jgi:hypothetical protein